jgi:hypothetical protein
MFEGARTVQDTRITTPLGSKGFFYTKPFFYLSRRYIQLASCTLRRVETG